MTKLILGVLYVLMLSDPLSCKGCFSNARLDFPFQTGNELNVLRHDVAIDVAGPGQPKTRIDVFKHGQFVAMTMEFEVLHRGQSQVDVIFTFTDIVTGRIKTKDVRLDVHKMTRIMATEHYLGWN